MNKQAKSEKLASFVDLGDACDTDVLSDRDSRGSLCKKKFFPFLDIPEKHTILIIDNKVQGASEFYEFCCKQLEKSISEYHYDLFLVSIAGKYHPKKETLLREIICIKKKLHGSEVLTHIRAVIIKADQILSHYGRTIRYYFPNLPVFFISCDKGSVGLKLEKFRDFSEKNLFFYIDCPDKNDCLKKVLDQISNMITDYSETPFWDALKSYAGQPAINFHCLPIGGARSITGSINDFCGFFGRNHLNAETSISTFPLDSLLMPHGAIKQAQEKASIAFGAHGYGESENKLQGNPLSHATGTRFVTNGTTAANHIIISAFVRPNDYVLLERNCHISHFHALANSYAKPLFLKPFVNSFGIAGPVPLELIRKTFSTHLEEKNCLPALIILTNPSFDGLFYKPQKVVAVFESVLSEYWDRYYNHGKLAKLVETLKPFLSTTAVTTPKALTQKETFIYAAFRRMVFLFDEAWGGSAYFHPELIEYSAMHAGSVLAQNKKQQFDGCLRFYSSQSTHKIFSAFRQGSMIHYRDPLMTLPEFRNAFESSFCSNTTSSPNASILASLDVARKQAQLEGFHLVEKCRSQAQGFRKYYKNHLNNDRSHLFCVAGFDQMLKNIDPDGEDLHADDYALDPMRVTIAWKAPISGKKIRELLLRGGIQINKYNSNSILVNFNIGTDESAVRRLKSELLSMSMELSGHGDSNFDDQVTAQFQDRVVASPCFPTEYGPQNLGFWQKNQGNFTHALIDVEDTYNEMMLKGLTISDIYISASFVVPYPPGVPVLVPGQRITLQDLAYLKSISINVLLGVEPVDGRMKLHVYPIT